MPSRARRVLVEAVIVAFSAWIAWQALGYGFGSFQEPGPGVFPLLVACIMGVAGLATGFSSLAAARAGSGQRSPASWDAWSRALAAWLILVAWIMVIKPIGAVAAIALVVLVVAMLMGATARFAGVVSAGVTAGIWLVFDRLFWVGLPMWPGLF